MATATTTRPARSTPRDAGPYCPPDPADAQALAEARGAYDVPPPPVPALPFGEWLSVQAAWYRSQGTPAALWLARSIDDAAQMVRYTKALTPDEHDDRLDALERFRDERLRAEGSGR